MTYFQLMRSRVLVSFATLVVVGATTVTLEQTGMFDRMSDWLVNQSRDAGLELDQLRIEGADQTSRQDILRVLDVDSGMPLLAVELEEIRSRLEELPWVRRAAVARRFPNELGIIIEEREPFALWQQDGKLSLIDVDGVIIVSEGLEPFSDLRILVGSGAPEAADELAVLGAIDPDLMARVRSAVRVGERRWDLVFSNGIRVKLPDNSADYDASAAFSRFSAMEANDRLLDREVSVIDMRFEDRVVLRVLPAGKRAMDGLEQTT